MVVCKNEVLIIEGFGGATIVMGDGDGLVGAEGSCMYRISADVLHRRKCRPPTDKHTHGVQGNMVGHEAKSITRSTITEPRL